MDIYDLAEKTFKQVSEDLTDYKQSLFAGHCTDIEQYRYLTGMIAGMDHVLAVMRTIMKGDDEDESED